MCSFLVKVALASQFVVISIISKIHSISEVAVSIMGQVLRNMQ
jgi:hypothetical protein